ncbi:MAG: hypothetical protein RL324_409 [Verrucomicrobiota bacterium]|jgi:hypothetical protein
MKTAALPHAPFECNDFPSWVPAVLVKELRQGLHTRGFFAIVILFHAVMVVAMTTTVIALPGATPAARAAAADTSNTFFWTLLAVMLLLVLPARALVGLRAEVDSRTLDLLVLTHLSAWRIVLGKWASLVAQGFLLLVSMLPYGFVRYFAGSVDLADDAFRCCLLLSGCGLLTAAALWCSGLPRMAAIPIVILIGYGTGMPAFRSAAGAVAYAGPLSFAADSPSLAVFDGVLLLLFFLVGAVRRIAAPAENYALVTRLLALPAFLPVPVFALMGKAELARYQFGLAACILIVVAAMEITSVRLPMGIHWRTFLKRGAPGRLVAPLFQPGWQSALAFTLLAGSVVCALVWWGGLYSPGERLSFLRLALLVAGGLAFPAALRAGLARKNKNTGAVYGLTIGALGLIAAVTSVFSNAPLMPRWWLEVASMLPVSAFWMEFTRGTPGNSVVLAQCAIAIVSLITACWQTRSYWKELAVLDAKERV